MSKVVYYSDVNGPYHKFFWYTTNYDKISNLLEKEEDYMKEKSHMVEKRIDSVFE